MKNYLAVSPAFWFGACIGALGAFFLVVGLFPGGSGGGAIVALSALFLVPGLLCVARGWFGGRARLRVLRSSTTAPGTVVENPKLRAGPGLGSMPLLVYQFQPTPGVTYDGSARVTTGTWNRFAAGDPITVAYDPANPRKSEPAIFAVRARQ